MNGTVTTTQYDGGYVYKDGGLQYFPHAEGYVNVTAIASNGSTSQYARFEYIYQYKDIWGSIRLSYLKDELSGDLQVVEEDNYYAFGMKHAVYNNAVTGLGNASAQKKLYQGQERQDELGLNWDSFKWRNYDYAIGRFMSVDPLADKYVYNSPYSFQENKMGLGRELEGLEIFFFGDIPPVPETLVEVATRTSEVTGKTNEHHIIPRALKNNETVKAAREDGFKFEGKENKMPVEQFTKTTGKGQHGNHPKYNKAVKQQLENGPPEGMTPVEFVRSVVKENKELIESKPDVKINEIYNVKTVIESTNTPKPELPRRIQPKEKEKPKPVNEDDLSHA